MRELALPFALLLGVACVGGRDAPPPPPPDEPTAIALVERFADAAIEGAVQPAPEGPSTEWRFDGGGSVPVVDPAHAATGGWRALHGISGLAVRDGRLAGRSGELPILIADAPGDLDPGGMLHAVEVRLRASDGTRLGVSFDAKDELDEDALVAEARGQPVAALSTDLIPGDGFQTYTLTSADSIFDPSFPFARMRRVLIRPTEVPGADFEIESVRLISRREHLASVPSGVGWHGLGDVYRETLVARAPERILLDLELPSAPRLDLWLGTIDNAPVTFEVGLAEAGDPTPRPLSRRTVSTAGRWEPVSIDLSAHAGRPVRLALALAAEAPGAIGFWGGPVIRNRAGRVGVAEPSPARRALGGDAPPRGVILIVADTLRRDSLQPYGHARRNAPVLTRLASEGALFRDAIAQGTWTKISVTSILTSLYPSTHGVVDMPDRIASAITTLAEAYREAGYATFATSSVPFTGKLSNLHQGIDVLHERASLDGADPRSAKTARHFVDRLLPWLEAHRDVPFFAFLHVFDPHSPFEPDRPYDRTWMDAERSAQHREDMAAVSEAVALPFFKVQALPTEAELEASGVDRERFLAGERAWYDASILAMDVEIGRLLERLEETGLARDTLIAFVSDHGEEFLEHGRHFHGYNAYGEMLNVPLILWWPGVVPVGVEVAETIETIDLMPTLLELSRIAPPAEVQGRSLLPLLAAPADPAALGWERRPAFAERARTVAAFPDDANGRASLAVVDDGWKLIVNTERPDGWPEYELFDHRSDPLNLDDVAEANPEVVARLAATVAAWHERAVAARIESDAAPQDLSAEELQRLRQLGYVQ